MAGSAKPIAEAVRSDDEILPLPNLIEIQLESYEWFLTDGLRELFDSFSPVEDYTGNIALEFMDYAIAEPKLSLEECRERDATYEAPLYVKVRLVNKEVGEIKESEVYMGELPKMTERGTFLINGAERVVISQLARSFGVYFRDSIDFSGRMLYSAQVIPNEGAWVEIDTDGVGVISIKVGQTRKFPVTTLLRALDWFEHGQQEQQAPPTGTDEEILTLFGTKERVDVTELPAIIAEQHAHQAPGVEVRDEFFSTGPVVDANGDAIVEPWSLISVADAKHIAGLGRKKLEVIRVPHQIAATLRVDNSHTAEEGLLDTYRKIRPGDPPTVESAESLIGSYFFDVKRYDLAPVGRYKMNKKLGIDVPLDARVLTRADILAIVHYLLGLPRGQGTTDDIDHLQNKRVRAVGELMQAQLRLGFLRMERVAKERMTSLEPDKMVAQSIISIKPIGAQVKSFFGSGSLSQFMDQINPLAELAHKRRLSALGPGGLSKQSAKLEVRDVHHSHYGRICPIETPEGPNIGLIGYLALHALLDPYGFIQTPYQVVKDGRVTEEVHYLTADEEEEKHIAPASAPIDEKGRFVDKRVQVRCSGKFPIVRPEEVHYRDVTAKQVFSVATALIPFLENDEPVRGLAGSNMQRQAVPLIVSERPLITTGMERRAAEDAGAVLLAEKAGRVLQSSADVIVVQYDGEAEPTTYRLQNFVRTNMGTCISQKRRVVKGQTVRKSQPLADGPCTRGGELALGKNLLVAFLPFEGNNYEDAVLISERLVKDDTFTSIHIEKFETEARDTKLGPEEITRDIPNVGEDALRDLDDTGIVRVGAEVRPEDILVGKVAPKGQSELTAEEKLVIAIFGKKAEEMRDVSLPVPHGEKGIVIATKVFSRYKYECDTCHVEFNFGKPPEVLECKRCAGNLKRRPGDELLPGVNQLVRIYVAQQRKVMVGDKLTGRHGNKGVIAKIMPEEDMPFLPDGTPIDICLNPLSVPSRMNMGQIIETHLGLIARQLGETYSCPIFEGIGQDVLWEGLQNVRDSMAMRAVRSYATDELNRFGDWVRLNGEATLADIEAAVVSQLAERTPEELEELGEWLGVEPEKVADGQRRTRAKAIYDRAVRNALVEAQLDPATGQMILYDGRTGEPFNKAVTVGYMYILKLLHLVEDKIHARSTGPYSLVTQQPLGGKAQFGGQRFGEMEVWALEAYGAAHTLQEILTIKSDDVMGRVKTYESIVKGENIQEPGVPESFKILIKELQSLGLQVTTETGEGRVVEMVESDEEFD
ncbi:MAG: DNA-directed RNA polymerase subunit beta [Armatimonadetes bacterium]|nr:DNA-directed RNA polymerase subunit beta [Armatimonadota bacterium]